MKGIEAVKSNIQAAKAVSRVRRMAAAAPAAVCSPYAACKRCAAAWPFPDLLSSSCCCICTAAACWHLSRLLTAHGTSCRCVRPTACLPCLCLPCPLLMPCIPLTHALTRGQFSCSLVQVLRTSLGPKGMDKMLQGPDGDIVISERTFRVSACCLLLPAVDAGLLCCVAGTVGGCLHLPTR